MSRPSLKAISVGPRLSRTGPARLSRPKPRAAKVREHPQRALSFTGSVLAFESRAQLTSYLTEGHSEIYRYDRSADEIACASCNPSGEPPLTDARFESGSRLPPQIVVYNLSSDGTRVFFETAEGLVLDDIDGTNDIYEWHQGGPGEPPDLSLISSGHSAEYTLPELFGGIPLDNDLLFGISPDGSNVMFSSEIRWSGQVGRAE